MGWLRFRKSAVLPPAAAQQCAFSIEDLTGVSYHLMESTFQLDQWESHDNINGGFLFSGNVGYGNWVFVCETWNADGPAAGVTTTLYARAANSSVLTSTTGNTHPKFAAGAQARRLLVGTDDAGNNSGFPQNEAFDGDQAGLIFYSGVVLTQAEVDAQSRQLAPIRRDGLHAFYDFQGSDYLQDKSGNGRDLKPLCDGTGLYGFPTGPGTWSIRADGPPIPYGYWDPRAQQPKPVIPPGITRPALRKLLAPVVPQKSTDIAQSGNVALAGNVVAGATVTGQLGESIGVAGSVSDAAVVVGALTETIVVAGSVVDAAVVVGALVESIGIAGAVSDAATLTGALTESIGVAGAASAAAVVTGAVKVAVGVAGSISDAAVATGVIAESVGVAGAISDAAVVVGALSTSIGIAGSVGPAAVVTGALKETISISGAVSSAAVVTGALVGSVLPLVGAVSSTAVVTGALTTAIGVSASISGAAVVTGSLSEAIGISGAISNAATATGTATSFLLVQGSIACAAVVTGNGVFSVPPGYYTALAEAARLAALAQQQNAKEIRYRLLSIRKYPWFK